jgi:hypothetical protein
LPIFFIRLRCFNDFPVPQISHQMNSDVKEGLRDGQ